MVDFLKGNSNFENLRDRAQNRVKNTISQFRNEREKRFENQNFLPLGIGALAISSLFFFLNRRRIGLRGSSFWGQFQTQLAGKTAADLMTDNPAFCKRDTSLQEVARLMVDHQCGEIPVVDENQRPIGVITDRDITCRTIAKGQNPLTVQAARVMSSPIIYVNHRDDVSKWINLFEENQIKRIPVVDDQGLLVGVLSQSDLVKFLGRNIPGGLFQKPSWPAQVAS
jgi:CBS domain-containing protein